MTWYALRHDGQYLRCGWLFLQRIGQPVTSMQIQDALLQYNLISAQAESRRLEFMLGIRFEPVEVQMVGRGREKKITLAHFQAGEGES